MIYYGGVVDFMVLGHKWRIRIFFHGHVNVWYVSFALNNLFLSPKIMVVQFKHKPLAKRLVDVCNHNKVKLWTIDIDSEAMVQDCRCSSWMHISLKKLESTSTIPSYFIYIYIFSGLCKRNCCRMNWKFLKFIGMSTCMRL
jgi:hypothetical protein